MAINFDAPMSWPEFKSLEKEEQHDYLQHLIDAYGANAVSFAQMFHNNANTVRRYIAENEIGIKLSRGSRVDGVRWNEFLNAQKAGKDAAFEADFQPASGMRVCSATMRFCGTIDVDAIAAELRRFFDGAPQGEVEISCAVKDE